LAGEDERHTLLSSLEDRFGIPEAVFDPYLLFKRKKSWTLLRASVHLSEAAQLKVSRIGLKALERVGRFLKPTTRLVQIFGFAASKATVEIDQEALRRLWEGEEVPVDHNLDNGYVILRLKGDRVLGVGLYIDGRIRSQIPKKDMREIMVTHETTPRP